MSDSEIESFIANNVVWDHLPHNLQQILGNSSKEYDKRILDYSIRHQLRYKGNLSEFNCELFVYVLEISVRFVKKSAEEYYDLVFKYALSKLMLFPYHLIDVFVGGLRLTPFEFYIQMMNVILSFSDWKKNATLQNIMKEEKSYDALPNFTAADCYRLLSIGRNEYIEMMNETRSYRKLFRRSKTLQEILPQKPVDFQIEPW